MTRLILILGTSILLGGCPQHTKGMSDYCDIYDPIRASRLDTQYTRDQVRDQNAAYDKLCVKQAAEKMLLK